jgi:phosphocarrier protein HPr
MQQNQDVMSGQVLRRTVTVTDPLGLHMRPITAFAKRAMEFQSSVIVAKNDQRVNGKSPLEMMLLAAEQGTELILEVSGSDAQAALDALAPILAAPSFDEPPDPPLPKKG